MPAHLAFMLSLDFNGVALALLAVAIAAAGVYLFVKGFRLLRFKRMILNTPLSRIHSASIGLVEVTGRPVGPCVLTAPVTGGPCYYYHVRAFQWEKSGNEHDWNCVLDENLCVPFFLEDTTGRVLVDPHNARMDVHRSFSDEINASIFRTPGMCPPNVRDFLARRGIIPVEKVKVEEHTIPPDFTLFVFGTLGENPILNTWSARPQRDSSPSASWGPFRAEIHVGPSPVSGAILADAAKPSSVKSNFGDFDLHPSAAISKGERGEPFTISAYSQHEVVGKLAWQSALCIWGGPAIALAALYFLMTYFGWID